MARKPINPGDQYGRGGDSRYYAYTKIEDNFEELYGLVDALPSEAAVVLKSDVVTGFSSSATDVPGSAKNDKDLWDAIQGLSVPGGFPTVVNDLVTGGATNALSAAQGVTLKELADDIQTDVTTLDGRVDALEPVVMPILRPEAYGAVGNGSTDDTAAFLLCAAACVTAKAKMVLAGKSYVISDTIPLDNGGSTFIGYPVEGSGIDATRILFKPASISTPCFKMTGGAGNSSNKSVRNLSIEKFDGTYAGLGIGIQVQNQCFAVAEDVHIEGLAVGVEIVNSGSGGFSEFNRFNRVRLLDNTRGIQFHRRSSGDNSYHGNEFNAVQINVPASGYGLYLNGTSIGGTANAGQAFLYNCVFNLKIFGGSGTRYAIYSDNVNTEGNVGNVVCESALTIDGTNGVFAVDGLLYSISTINKGSGAANIRFSRFVTGKALQTTFAAFSDANVSAFTPGPMDNLQSLERVNTVAPALFPMRGSNRESIGMAFYNGDFSNGLWLFESAFGSTDPSALTPRLHFQYNGEKITSYGTQLNIAEAGVTGGQLVLNDGRYGGKLGRLPPVTSIASSGSPQTISLWANTDSARASEFYIRLTTATVTDYDHRIRGCFYSAPSGLAGRVVIFDQYSFYDTTAGAVTAMPSLSVNTSGVLRLTLTTDRALTISGWEISGGYVLTA
jgi:hypothetical protein